MLESSPLSEEYDLFNSKYFWKKPSIKHLIETFKKAYDTHKNNKNLIANKQTYGYNKAKELSYSNIGKLICP
jgi:hypothetical protein